MSHGLFDDRFRNQHIETGCTLKCRSTNGVEEATVVCWVIGTLNGHRFNALVFPEHAENPMFEMGDSRISKLWVQRLADKVMVANFDRGWDVRPTTDIANEIVGFLAAGLADYTYGS